MRTGEDFRREYPAMDEGFKRAAEKALDEIEEGRYVYKKIRFSLVAAALCVLLLSVGVAATVGHWQIDDFFVSGFRALNPSQRTADALEAAQVDIEIDTGKAAFRVTQAVYDGWAVYMVLEAVPKQADTMLVSFGMQDQDQQAASYGSSYPADMSLRAYAASKGYKDIRYVMFSSDQTTAHTFDSYINEDGVVSFMLWALVRPEYRELDALELDLNVSLWQERVKQSGPLYEAETQITLPKIRENRTVCSMPGETAVFENAGVEVTGVKLVETGMTTYCIVNYDVIDKAKYREHYTHRGALVRILDEDEREVPRGTYPINVMVDRPYQMLGDETCYITSRMMDELPGSITLGEWAGSEASGWMEGSIYTFQLEQTP